MLRDAIVIKRMVADLNMPLEIVVCPTVREADGLAVSSRNRYLSEQERREATALYRSLAMCREMVAAGARDAAEIRAAMVAVLETVAALEIEYVSLVDAETLEEVEEVAGRVLVAVAARLGPARLIDNMVLDGSGQ